MLSLSIFLLFAPLETGVHEVEGGGGLGLAMMSRPNMKLETQARNSKENLPPSRRSGFARMLRTSHMMSVLGSADSRSHHGCGRLRNAIGSTLRFSQRRAGRINSKVRVVGALLDAVAYEANAKARDSVAPTITNSPKSLAT
ncbi:hypothetical protein F4678DRAFT_201039 [Xylaria arbuscula]|nr:hypothetical protein F4678DRAFT_201039 [Xylaria arbuscula]